MRIALDTALRRSAWYEYPSRTALAVLVGAAREEVNRAVAELADDKRFIRLEERGHALRVWPEWDPAQWASTPIMGDEEYALARRAGKTTADEQQPDLAGFPSWVWDDLHEARLSAALESALAGDPTVGTTDSPRSLSVEPTPLSDGPTVGITPRPASPNAQVTPAQVPTPRLSVVPTVCGSYSYSYSTEVQLTVPAASIPKGTALADYKQRLRAAHPEQLLALCRELMSASLCRPGPDGQPRNYTAAWAKYCREQPDHVREVLCELSDELRQGRPIRNVAAVAYKMLVARGAIGREC